MRTYRQHYFFLLLFSFAIGMTFTACEEMPPLKNTFVKQTAREAYLDALKAGGLDDTRMVKAWVQAGDRALQDSILIDAPFRETGFFSAEEPAAAAYRFALEEGERMQIRVQTERADVKLFMDLYRIDTADSTETFRWTYSPEAPPPDSLSYEPEKSGHFLLRIQPELLADCRYTIELVPQPAYGFFPVSGKGNADIWSFFGDPRDGGRRQHEGIDIFAPRGTPVVAVTGGRVRARDRGLGGKQIWLRDQSRGQSMYYAHLDSQLVQSGAMVRPGDTIGWVGNTGNAAGTSPHLHFGIYRRNRGAVDPHPYVALQPAEVPSLRADTSMLGRMGRVLAAPARLQSAPHDLADTKEVLPRHLPLRIEAASGRWYRVQLPEGKTGYISANQVEPADKPLRELALDSTRQILVEPLASALSLTTLQTNSKVEVLGQTSGFQLVRVSNKVTGWLPAD